MFFKFLLFKHVHPTLGKIIRKCIKVHIITLGVVADDVPPDIISIANATLDPIKI